MKNKKQLNEELKGLGTSLKVLLEELQQLHDIIMVTIRGLSLTQGIPKAMEALTTINRVLGEEHENEVDREKAATEVKRVVEVARQEIDKGFPFLFCQASLMLYAHLEGSIKRLVVEFFERSRSIGGVKEVATLKMTFGQYNSLNEEERFDYLFSLYEKNVALGIQYGVTRFEALLTPLGLGGDVDENTKKEIYVLSQLRNSLLHRGGIVDRYLIESCPFLSLRIGDKIAISGLQYESFFQATFNYALTVLSRVCEMRGLDTSSFEQLKSKGDQKKG